MKYFILILSLLLLTGCDSKLNEFSPQECLDLGGRTLNIVGGDDCGDEVNIGKVVGFISPNICCLKIESFEDCAKVFPVMESYPRQCRAGDRIFVE